MSLTVYIDMSKYVKEYSDTFLTMTAKSVETLASQKVRVDTGNLKNSIQMQQVGPYKWIVFSQAPYATSQEYGLRSNYGFTPYMRPAAKETESNMNELANRSQKVAIRKSTVNRRYD